MPITRSHKNKMIKLSLTEWIGVILTGMLGNLWLEVTSLKKASMAKNLHDELCALRISPIIEDIAEMKREIESAGLQTRDDMKELRADVKGLKEDIKSDLREIKEDIRKALSTSHN